MDIIFATKNKGKLKEINEIMHGTSYNVISMEDAGVNIDVLEDGNTYEENAMKKAVQIMEVTKTIVLADDSGIEIEFFNKKPGVNSSTFLGGNSLYKERNEKIVEMMKDAKGAERGAKFVSVIALATPKDDRLFSHGILEGYISNKPQGQNGFGYDSVFYVPEYDMTLAQMTLELKNKISHRSKALNEMKDILIKISL